MGGNEGVGMGRELSCLKVNEWGLVFKKPNTVSDLWRPQQVKWDSGTTAPSAAWLSPFPSLPSPSLPRLSHPWSWLGDFAPVLPIPGKLSPQIFTGLVPPVTSGVWWRFDRRSSEDHWKDRNMCHFLEWPCLFSCVFWLSLPLHIKYKHLRSRNLV